MTPPPPPAQRGPRVPLRVTLVALLVALVAVGLAATGVAATSLLKDYLQDQQDEELSFTARSIAGDPGWARRFCDGGPRYPSSDFVGCLVPADSQVVVFAGPLDDQDTLPEFDRVAAHVADTTDGGDDGDGDGDGEGGPGDPDELEPFTVRAQDGSTSWRMVAVALPDGNAALFGSDLAGDKKAISRLVRIEVFVGLVVLALLGAAGYLLVRNSLRPLEEVGDTARAIAGGDLSRRVPAGDERTEVGRLSVALNGMLARIERAFSAQRASEAQARASEGRMRQFIADASHELRTPLTSIRGFAELYRQGAVRDEEDVARLMQRIESEGGRMGLLVEDLLQLARLDQQRPLTVTPVDLAEVAADVVHDARAVQPDRPLELVLDPAMTELPVVLGDEARLRQVIGNLVTNALVHTPGDAPVTVTVSEEPGETGAEDDGGTVLVRVADEGPGMPSDDAARVFERFYRADPSRQRAAGGTGLGLSIVASLVAAHGGTVDLRTAPGEGAVFTVRLPRSGPPGPAGVPG